VAVTVTEKGRTNSIVSATSQDCAFTGSIAAGRTVVVFIDAPTGSTNTSVAVTDTKGNTYVTQEALFHNAYAPAVAIATLTAGVTASDHLTATLAVGSAAWVITVLDLGVVGAVDVSGNFPNDGATHATPSVTSSAAAAANGQIVLAAFANTNTTHTFSAPLGYTLNPAGVNQANTGSNARQLWVEWQEYTGGAGGVRTASGSYATAANYAAVMVAINVTPGGGGGGGWAPTEVGRTVDATAATSKTVTTTQAVPAGHHLVLLADIPAGTPITTCTVTVTGAGNTWTTRAISGDANFAPVIADLIVSTALSSGAVITVTVDHSSGGWKLLVLDLGAVGVYDTSGIQPAGTTTAAPTVSTAGNAAINHQYVLAIFCNTNTTHAFSPGTGLGYTALPGGALTTGTGSTSNNMWAMYQEYTVGAGAPRTAAGAFATAGNYAAAVVAINADAVTTSRAKIGGVWVPTMRLTRSGGSWV
jgi:hypothetical protein